MYCALLTKILVRRTCNTAIQLWQKRKISYLHNIGSEPLKPLTLGIMLENTVKKHGDRLAIISKHQDKRLTYSDVLNQADRLAAGLMNIGLENGDRVGIWAQNLIEWYISFMACARAGYITVAIHPGYQPKELEYCVNKVGIKSIICGHKFQKQNYYEVLNQLHPELPKNEPGKINSKRLPSLRSIVTISDESLRGTYNYSEVLDLATESSIQFIRKNQSDINMDDPVNIQLTSGTTGRPKAAAISHFNLVNNGYNIGKRNEMSKKHHTVCIQVPLFHSFGTVVSISGCVTHGATMVLPADRFDPHKSLDAIKEENCTVVYGTPTMYVDLVRVQKERKENIATTEVAFTGGAPCSPSLFKDMLKILGVQRVKSIYGMTETTGVVFQAMTDDDEEKSTSTVGYIHDHIEAKVIDERGKIVPFGVPGELCIRGYCNMLGYWNDEEKTKEIIGLDGWLKTGDQFILEENGYGRIVGRLKEMIIRGGENIFPKEIEDFLNTYPYILESYVIGLPHERLGEEVCACVRAQEGHTITLEDIKHFCKGNISYFKVPSVLVLIENIPKTLSGKVQKFKLLEHVQNNRVT